MLETHPMLRLDLEIRPDPQRPDDAFIVKDPVQHKFFRFPTVQTVVLNLLDGSRSCEEIAVAASADTGLPVTQDQVAQFAVNLRRLLLLEEPAVRRQLERPARRRQRLLGSLLSVKLYSFDPDRLLGSLERRLGFFFTRGFASVVAASVTAAAIISIVNVGTLFHSLSSLVSLYSVPLVLLVAFGVMTLHEFGHGITLKHFGGSVREMGLLVLYFIPAFYCNLDDAWTLGRRQRIYVSLAGGYVQLFVWAMATVAWRLLSPETVGSRVCLIAIGFSGIQALVNFNPLIRLDGYYVLSDALRIENLRRKSFAYLRRRLRFLFVGGGGGSQWETPTLRERRIFTTYGTTAFVFTAGLLWFVFERLGGWLVSRYQTWGVVLLSALVLMAVPRPERPALAPASKPGRRVVVRASRSIVWLAVIVLLAIVACLPWELKVSGEFTVIPTERATVNPQVEGTLKSIFVDEGSSVRKGDLLAELQNLDLINDFEETKGELATKKAQLELLKAGSRHEEIARAEKQVETKQAELDTALRVQQERTVLQDAIARREAEVANAERTYGRMKQLFEQGLVPKSDVERDQTLYEVRKQELAEARGELRVLEEKVSRTSQVKSKELEQARSELAILRAGTRQESIREAEAQVAKLSEQAKVLEHQLEQTKIRSQIDGVVSTRNLHNLLGQYMRQGDVLCEIVNDRVVNVDMPVPEKEIADVRAGNRITMKVRGYPRMSFEARVQSMSTVAFEQSQQRMVMVRGTLENKDRLLKSEMTGVGKILCGKRLIGELATRRAVRWLRTEFWEYLP